MSLGARQPACELVDAARVRQALFPELGVPEDEALARAVVFAGVGVADGQQPQPAAGLLGAVAEETGKNNISFLSHFILGDVDKCLDILIKTDRIP